MTGWVFHAWDWFKNTWLGIYLGNVIWGVDVFVNVLTGGKQETISARLGRWRDIGKVADVVCDALDIIDPGHCEESKEFWNNVHKKEEKIPEDKCI